MGTMNFDGRYTSQFPNQAASRGATGHSIADAMLGVVRNTSTGLPIGEDMRIPYWGFYAQDDWRVTPRLTLNLGLRWDQDRPITERFNRGSSFDFARTEPS